MRLQIQRSKTDAIYYVIESTYINKKHSTRVVERLGKESELRKMHPDPEAWAREYVQELNGKQTGKDAKIRPELNPSERIPANTAQLYSGGYLFLQKLYTDLGLDKICKDITKRHQFTYNLNSILSRLIYGRILTPASKLGTMEFSETLLEKPDFELHQIYRALEVIAKETDFIQAELYKNSKEVIQRNDKILYYDCTNYYFETENEDGFRMYGVSKENRPNPIVQMGLFMDGDGLPLAFCINPGNTNEQTTMKPLEEKILSDFGNSRFIVCTDAGLSSRQNRLFNSRNSRAFITTQSIKKMPEKRRMWALSAEKWRIPGQKGYYNLEHILSTPERTEEHRDDIFYKEEWFIDDGKEKLEQRFIITFSIKHMRYQRQIRERQIDRAKAALVSPDRLDRTRQTDYKRLIRKVSCTAEGEVAEKTAYVLDEAVITAEEQYDGFYAVATNLEDAAADIINVNRRRWEIEECFRIMKSEFKARPVYLSREDRIRAHFMTCYLALMIYRCLEKKLGEKYTCEQLIETLREMKFHSLSGDGWMPMYKRTEITDSLHEAFGFWTDYQIMKQSKMKKIIAQTKKRDTLLKKQEKAQ